MAISHLYRVRFPVILCILVLAFSSITAYGQDEFAFEKAIATATEKVSPSLVRIETLGGFEQVGKILVGTGPTTGLIIDEEGYIISSAFNFAQMPSQIIVITNDGSRHPAKLVSTDHSNRLVLLKIQTDQKFSVVEAANSEEISVGQTAIAMGRAFDGDKPNLSVGIVSAVNRIWGKAIQTDAKISPNNYGGALIDLNGRVLGILTPLSTMPGNQEAGVEWYDSGIGFAVPLQTVQKNLAKMKSGEDLYQGLLGITPKGNDLYSSAVLLAAVQPNSPAYKAGLKAGDTVIEIDGIPITRQAQLKHVLGPRFAGEKVAITVKRGKEKIKKEIELVGKLAPFQHPFLGILPMREADERIKDDGAKGSEKKPASAISGVKVRTVYLNSPASKAGIKPGDRIITADDKEITTRTSLVDVLNSLNVNNTIAIKIDRAGKEETLHAKLTKLPEGLPPDLPPAHASIGQPNESSPPQTGIITIKIPEISNVASALIPSTYQANVPHGLLIWCHSAGGIKDEELTDRWEAIVKKYDLIVVAPRSADPAKWQKSESEFIRKAVNDVLGKYNIDRSRIVVAGQDAGGTMAWHIGFLNRDIIRGIATVNAIPPSGVTPPATDAVNRLAFLVAASGKGAEREKFNAVAKRLRELLHPVTLFDLGEVNRSFDENERNEIARWIDCLDRL